MKGTMRKSVLWTVVAMLLLLGSTAVANTRSPEATGKSTDQQWSALDRVPRFIQEIEDAGFTWQEGSFSFVDLITEACEGRYFTAAGNNPWPNAYFQLQMPNPEGANYELPYAPLWQMEQDESIVIIGQTPPTVRYFSIQSWVQLGPATNLDPTLPVPQTRTFIGSAVGDTTNNLTAHTIGNDPFNRPIVYIIVGNRETERRVRAAALAAGYPAAIINVETISPAIAPLGIGPAGSILVTAQRNAVPLDQAAFERYVRSSIPGDPLYDPPYRAFRLSPVETLDADPYPVPTLRVRGTGQSEMDLYPALKSLRQAIFAREAELHPGLPAKELGVRFWQDPMQNGQLEYIDEPWAGLQRGLYSYLGSRDTNYLQTYPYFKLRSDVDEYVIVYGVNHQRTGKTIYASFSVYVEPTFLTGREIGLGTVNDPRFDWAGPPGDSARQYLQPDDPYYEYADMLYAWKVARHCPEDEPYCLEVGNPTNINGIPYNDYCDPQISLDPTPGEPAWKTDVFVVFRGYMEPATAVSPDSNELVWDQAIYFGPYFEEP